MMSIFNLRTTVLWSLLLSLMIAGCSLMPKYDRVAYQQATALKVDSLALMGKATHPYLNYERAVETLKLKVDKAYEYAKGRPNNEIITKQWSIMRDPNRKLLGGFLARWKNKGILREIFIEEAKKNVSLGFDQIIGLESGLIKPKDSE
ncbi:MAG: hypothetical protein GY846_09965 [Deltaproteobacteria bacterium]|nr:hypothetical protein [Deltaproteobacteria bacterium]